jgi:SAM-dependent methyltransferase
LTAPAWNTPLNWLPWLWEHSGLPVFEADFETFDFSRMNMDGALLIGTLVHIPHERFPQILSHILKALKPEGLALITRILNRSAWICPNAE